MLTRLVHIDIRVRRGLEQVPLAMKSGLVLRLPEVPLLRGPHGVTMQMR